MADKVTLNILHLNSSDSLLSEVQNKYLNSGKLDIHYVSSFDEVMKTANPRNGVVLMFSISNREEFDSSLNILKKMFKAIKKGLVKPVCITNNLSSKLERILYKLGCTDIFSQNTNPKALVLKLDMWLWTLNQVLDKDEEHLAIKSRQEKVEEQSISFENDYIDNNAEAELESFLKETTDSNIAVSEPDYYRYMDEAGQEQHLNVESGSLEVKFKLLESDEKYSCSLEDFDEENLTIEVDEDIIATTDQNIDISVKFNYNKCKVEIELAGDILDIERNESKKKNLVIKLTKKDVEGFDYFVSLFQKRQKSISDFLDLAKGI